MSIKVPTTEHPVSDIVRNRWSPRAFSRKPVDAPVLKAILEAASWAPSANNLQPWSYVYASKQHPEQFEKLKSILLPGNHLWAQHADVLILASAITAYGPENTPNKYAWYDLGAANATLLLEARQHEVFGHVMAGFDRVKAKEVFHFPEHVEPVVMIALGHLGEASQLDEPFYTREITPRSRKTLDEFAFEGDFAS